MSVFSLASPSIPSMSHQHVASHEREMYDALMDYEERLVDPELEQAEKYLAEQEEEDYERYREMLKSKREKPMDRIGRFRFSPIKNIANELSNCDISSLADDEKPPSPSKKRRRISISQDMKSPSAAPISQSSVNQIPTPISKKRNLEPPSLITKSTSRSGDFHRIGKTTSASKWLSNMLNVIDEKACAGYHEEDGYSEAEDDLFADDGTSLPSIMKHQSLPARKVESPGQALSEKHRQVYETFVLRWF